MDRKCIKLSTIKALFAKSGNECAFPACNHPLVDDRNLFVGELCHINAINKKDARFDNNLDDEYLRSYDNLILLCHAHHKRIDSFQDEYTADGLKDMRSKHESKFINNPFIVSDATGQDTAIEMEIEDWQPFLIQAIEYLESDLFDGTGGQQGMNRTSADIGFILDAELMIHYMKLINSLKATEKRNLYNQQKEWLEKRRQYTSSQVESHGGSFASLEYYLAFNEYTRQRISELKNKIDSITTT